MTSPQANDKSIDRYRYDRAQLLSEIDRLEREVKSLQQEAERLRKRITKLEKTL